MSWFVGIFVNWTTTIWDELFELTHLVKMVCLFCFLLFNEHRKSGLGPWPFAFYNCHGSFYFSIFFLVLFPFRNVLSFQLLLMHGSCWLIAFWLLSANRSWLLHASWLRGSLLAFQWVSLIYVTGMTLVFNFSLFFFLFENYHFWLSSSCL